MNQLKDWPELFVRRVLIGTSGKIYIAWDRVSDIFVNERSDLVCIYKPVQVMRRTKDGLMAVPVRGKRAKQGKGGATTKKFPGD
jgi:hypothetical protein